MSQLSGSSRPKLRAGCRLRESKEKGDFLLMPEGALRLAGTGRKILERCDGQHTLDDIIRDLKKEYPAVTAERVEAEVPAFIERLHQKSVLDY